MKISNYFNLIFKDKSPELQKLKIVFVVPNNKKIMLADCQCLFIIQIKENKKGDYEKNDQKSFK